MAISLVALFLMAGARGFSDEPAKNPKPAKKPDPTEKPQTEPEKSFFDSRAYRPSDSIFHSSGINGPVPMPAPVPPPTVRAPSRRDIERRDREKNWIFLRPGDEKQETAEDLLGVTGALDDSKPKSLVTKFLENKQSAEPSALNRAKTGSLSGSQQNDFDVSHVFGSGNDPTTGLRAWDQSSSVPEGLRGNGGSQMSLAEHWQASHQPGAQKALEAKRVRMNAFENLFNVGNISPNLGVLGDLSSKLGAPAANSPTGNSDVLNRPYGRETRSMAGELRNPPRPLAGANPLPQPTINERVFGASSISLPNLEPQRNVSQPAMLPIPKRHF